MKEVSSRDTLVLYDLSALHRGSSSICWVLVRDLAIDMHFFGVIGFLWIKSTSYDGP